MADSWTTRIYNNGEYVEVKRNSQAVSHIRLSSVPPHTAGTYKAASAVVLSGKEVAVDLTDGRTLIFDIRGHYLRGA